MISCDPEVMGGTPVFAGTRVPVQTFLDYLEAGDSIDEFLEGFPSVSREQAIEFLEQAKDRLVAAFSIRTMPRQYVGASAVAAAFAGAAPIDHERFRSDLDALVDQDPSPRG